MIRRILAAAGLIDREGDDRRIEKSCFLAAARVGCEVEDRRDPEWLC